LECLGLDVSILVTHWLRDGLAAVLPTAAVFRLTGPLLCEGWSEPARFLLVLLGQAAKGLKDCSDVAAARRVLSLEFLGQGKASLTLDALARSAFHLRLQPRRSAVKVAEAAEAAGKTICAPLEEKSDRLSWPRLGSEVPSLVSLALLVDLWSGLLPPLTRLRRLRRVFSCSQDGYSLATLVQRCEDLTADVGSNVPMLFLVATDCCGVLGGYAPLLWSFTGASFAPRVAGFEDSFVFVAPREPPQKELGPMQTLGSMQVFPWSGRNELLLQLCNGLLFGGDLPAISIDDELNHGASSVCETFGSPPLTPPSAESLPHEGLRGAAASLSPSRREPSAQSPVNFKVSAIEVFAFVEV